MSKYFGTSQSGVVGAPQVLGGFLMGHRKSLISPVSASLVFSLQTVLQLYKYKMKITRWELYLFSGALVSETTMFWSMKMSRARRKPRPMALTTFMADSLSNGATLKTGRSWTLKTGTVQRGGEGITTGGVRTQSINQRAWSTNFQKWIWSVGRTKQGRWHHFSVPAGSCNVAITAINTKLISGNRAWPLILSHQS